MATRVIHFGPDDCHRLMVLQSAGYFVDTCDSLGQLHDSLQAGGEADAVLMSEGEGFTPEEVVSLARTHSAAPVVLFSGSNRTFEDSKFDLVVHTLTPPGVWLNEVDALIARSKVLRSHAEALARVSAQLKFQAAALVKKSQSDRQRASQERARNAGPAANEAPHQDSSGVE